MKSLNPYKILLVKFYNIAVITERQWSPKLAMPEWLSVVSASIFIGLNCGGLIMLYSCKTGYSFYIKPIYVIILWVFLLALGYFVFVRNKKYEEIAKSYNQKANSIKRVHTVIFCLYIFFSLYLLSEPFC